MKRILGVFCSDKSERIGVGTTSKATKRQISWFVIDDGTGQYVVQPLMENNLPSPIHQTVPRNTFQSNYKVDALSYRKNIFPVLQSLRRKIGKTKGFVNTDSLKDEEKIVFKALVTAGTKGDAGSASTKYKTVRYLLENLEDTGDVLESYRQEIVRDSITLRKAGKLDMALEVYRRAYELNPKDDHLLFNMARVLQATGKDDKAVRCLVRALTINPTLVPAHRMYKYITGSDFIPKPTRAAAPKNAQGEERRIEPRLKLPDISAAARFGDTKSSILLQNISCNGMQVKLGSKPVQPIKAGALFTLESAPDNLAEIFKDTKVEVMWLGNGLLGTQFKKPLSKDTQSLAQLFSLG